MSTNIQNENDSVTLKDLYIELERKDLVIKNLQSQLLSTQSQTDLLLTTKKDETSLKETNLRSQLAQRDQLLKEKDNKIEQLQNDINSMQKTFLDLKEENSTLKQTIEENEITIKNIQLRYNAKDDENKKLRVEYDNKITLLHKEKKVIEAKTSQLVEIIKQYSKELSDYSIHIESIEAEKKTLSALNQKLNERNDDNIKLLNQYKNEIEKIDNLSKENYSLHQQVEQIQKDYEDIKNDNDKLIKDKKSYENHITELTSKCAQYESLQKSYDELSNDFISLKSKLSQVEINNNINLNRANDSENELNTLSISINNSLISLVEWIETYFGINYDYEIPQIPNANINNIKFDILYDCLTKKKNKINDYMKQYENMNKENQNRIGELLEQISKLQNDNNTYKKDIIDIKKSMVVSEEKIQTISRDNAMKDDIINDIKKQNEKIEGDYNSLIEMINMKVYNTINDILNKNKSLIKFFSHDQKNNVDCNKIDLLENNLYKLFNFINLLIEDYSKSTSMNESLSNELNQQKSMIENEISNRISSYSNTIKNNEAIIRKLSDESQTLREKLRFIEKKLNGLQTENELKDLQIKSQEEIINRRKKKSDTSSMSARSDDSMIKNLEADKQKLLTDNILLINDNKYLKEQLDRLSQMIGKQNGN